MARQRITIDPMPEGHVVLVFDADDDGQWGRTTIDFTEGAWAEFVVAVLRAVPIYNVAHRPRRFGKS